MHAFLLKDHFARIGARVKVSLLPAHVGAPGDVHVLVAVAVDDRGEFFDVQLRSDQDVVLDVSESRSVERALLLRVVDGVDGRVLNRFLCGQDGHRWFVRPVSAEDADLGVSALVRSTAPDSVGFVRSLRGAGSVDAEGARAVRPASPIRHESSLGDVGRWQSLSVLPARGPGGPSG